ncbi:MAG: hypothetical protein MI784_07180 [Cytophagales bacterium]|nr:hypothetical protein [Cytophagales bacterium]
MNTLTQTKAAQYFERLKAQTGCHSYLFSPTPCAIDRQLFKRLNETVPELLDIIDTPEYTEYCSKHNEWNLPFYEMKRTDFTGAADFLLTKDGAKLIEININLPGKIGLMQSLGEAGAECLNIPENSSVNLGFFAQFAETICRALPGAKNIGILYSHLDSSKEHIPHYRYFAEELRKQRLSVRLIPANEIRVSVSGCVHKEEEFDAFISLVIPFVWERNPEEFRALTDLLKKHPQAIFPNPSGGMLGTKNLLSYLGQKKNETGGGSWKRFVLDAFPLKMFPDENELLKRFPAEKMVLKPLKDYDAKGVYTQPDMSTIQKIFRKKHAEYMVQEYTDSLQQAMLDENGKEKLTHSIILRMMFREKQCFGWHVYYILNDPQGDYYTAPVHLADER